MIKVGFVLSLDASWQGGINYYRNLFNAIYELPNRKLELLIFLGHKNIQLIAEDLPEVKIIVSSAFDRYSLLWWVRKFFQKIFYRDPVLWLMLRRYKVDILSHFNEPVVFKQTPVISWIPDFQHIHLPDFFSQKEIKARNKFFQFLAKSSKSVILSSFAAIKDFNEFTPNYSHKARALQFCINPNLKCHYMSTLTELQKRYNFNGSYFFLPNQFWAHKNHQVVIDALSLAVKTNKDLQIICTGNKSDYRQPKYFENLMEQINSLGLEKNFKILGQVPYQDLISLMNHAVAIINPSHFEGWSTTVEEAKLLGKKVLLSNIEVHVEQSPCEALYFDVNDSQRLAGYLIGCANNRQNNKAINQCLSSSYDELFREYGVKYQQIVLESITK
jgi:glycosyltransferase involved in cell wall biosynthesis